MNISSLFVNITIMTNASMITDLDTIMMIVTFDPDYQEDDEDVVDDVDEQGPALLLASAHLGRALHCCASLRH